MKEARVSLMLLMSMVTGGYSGAVPDQSRHYPDRETISGTVQEFRYHVEPVERPEGQILHSVIRLVLSDGRNIPVDVGARSNVAKLNLKEGKRIQLTGKYETVSGRPLFVAEEIRVGGKKIKLKREGAKKDEARGKGPAAAATNSSGASQEN